MTLDNTTVQVYIESLFPELTGTYSIQYDQVPSDPKSIGILLGLGRASLKYLGMEDNSQDIQRGTILIRLMNDKYSEGLEDITRLYKAFERLVKGNSVITTLGNSRYIGRDETERYEFNLTTLIDYCREDEE